MVWLVEPVSVKATGICAETDSSPKLAVTVLVPPATLLVELVQV